MALAGPREPIASPVRTLSSNKARFQRPPTSEPSTTSRWGPPRELWEGHPFASSCVVQPRGVRPHPCWLRMLRWPGLPGGLASFRLRSTPRPAAAQRELLPPQQKKKGSSPMQRGHCRPGAGPRGGGRRPRLQSGHQPRLRRPPSGSAERARRLLSLNISARLHLPPAGDGADDGGVNGELRSVPQRKAVGHNPNATCAHRRMGASQVKSGLKARRQPIKGKSSINYTEKIRKAALTRGP